MYDVIIVGGGPSGASAGRRAGMLGLNTLLLEKEDFPRYKPCGGGLSMRTFSYLDFELPKSMIERDISGVRINFKGQFVERGKRDRMVVLVSRPVFDNFLFEKARETGIEVNCGEKVIKCDERQGCVEVTTTDNICQARFVLIEEGSQGVLKYGVRERRGLHLSRALGLLRKFPTPGKWVRTGFQGFLKFISGLQGEGTAGSFPMQGITLWA